MSGEKSEISFPFPPKRWGEKESAFGPISAKEFLAQEYGDEAEWVLEDYLPIGGLVVLAAKPKVGKTTMVYHLAVKIAKGEEFLGRQTATCGVLILALEEHPRCVQERLKDLQGECENLYIQTGQVTANDLTAIAQFVKERGIKLIVVDTLGMFWSVYDENDSTAVKREIVPLLHLARQSDACVLLIHHCRKGEGDGRDGDEIRGSGALLAAVDVGLVMQRNGVERRRKLKAISRYAETPKELVIALENGSYTVVTDPTSEHRSAERDRLAAALSANPEEIETLADNAKVPVKKVYSHMKALVIEGKAQQHGKGVKGDRYKYSKVSQDCLSSTPSSLRKETERELPSQDEDWWSEITELAEGEGGLRGRSA